MEQTINELFIKLSSKVPYPKEIKLGEDIDVMIENYNYTFNCVSTQDKDNQDNTVDRIYTLKSLIE